MKRRQFFRQIASAASAMALVPSAMLPAPGPTPGRFYTPKPGDVIAPLVVSAAWAAGQLQVTFYNPNDVPVGIETRSVGFADTESGLMVPESALWRWSPSPPLAHKDVAHTITDGPVNWGELSL